MGSEMCIRDSSMEVSGTGPTLHHTGAPQVLEQNNTEAIPVECVTSQTSETKVSTAGAFVPKTEVWSSPVGHSMVSGNHMVSMTPGHATQSNRLMCWPPQSSLHPYDQAAARSLASLPTPHHQVPYQVGGSVSQIPAQRTVPKVPLPRLPAPDFWCTISYLSLIHI